MRLRERYSKVSVGRLCNLFGRTRHAFYDKLWHERKKISQEELVLEMLLEIRRDMPGAGIPTIYQLIRRPLITHGIKMGRDAVQELRRRYGLIKKPRRSYVATTDSKHRFRKYPNIIRELKVTRVAELWVCDITYIRVRKDFNFLSLVCDVYSRKIIGYCLHPTLAKEGPLTALRMAIQTLDGPPETLIHHSDRGIQYCCDEYVQELELYDIAISMTEKGDPYENPVAERLNGILKKIFGLNKAFQNRRDALKAVKKVIMLYNTVRPHTSVEKLTPQQAHNCKGILNRTWKHTKRKLL
jgi:transposase InsO family protein